MEETTEVVVNCPTCKPIAERMLAVITVAAEAHDELAKLLAVAPEPKLYAIGAAMDLLKLVEQLKRELETETERT